MTSIAAHPRATWRRLSLVSPISVLTLLVAMSAIARFALGLQRETHRYFPDEFLYGQLARSLADGHGLSVLGVPTRFPAVVQPLLTAPFWLTGDPELAFRLTQVLNACAMSLAAIPVYLIARQVELRPWPSLACAAAAVLSPNLVYAGYVTADALGYTLALFAVLLAVRQLSSPSRVGQMLFLATTLLATATRLQYAVFLPAVMLAGLLTVRPQGFRVLLRQNSVLAMAAVVGLAGVAVLRERVLGPYVSVLDVHASTDLLRWLGSAAFLLALAAGPVVVPAAVAWTSALLRGASAGPARCYAALLVALALALCFLSSVIAVHGDSPRFFERYLMILMPLTFVAFAAGVSGHYPRTPAVSSAVAVAAVLALVPLSTFTASQGKADSPSLLALSTLEDAFGVGTAGLAVALGSTLAIGIGLLACFGRLRLGHALAVGLAGYALVSVGAHTADVKLSARVLSATFAGDPQWVDRQRVGSVLLVQAPGSDASDAMGLSLRNAAVTAAATLGDVSRPIDGTRGELEVLADGELVFNGRPVRQPLLVTSRTARLVFEGSRPIKRVAASELYGPDERRRVAAIVEGLGAGGLLARRGRIVTFRGTESGCLQLSLHAEGRSGPGVLRLRRGETKPRLVVVTATRPITVSMPPREGRSTFTVSSVGRADLRARAFVAPCTNR